MTLEVVWEKAHADLLCEWLWCVALRGEAPLCDSSTIFNLQNATFLSGTTEWICAACFQFIQRWHIVGSLLFINVWKGWKGSSRYWSFQLNACEKIKLFGTWNRPIWIKSFGFVVFCYHKAADNDYTKSECLQKYLWRKSIAFSYFFLSPEEDEMQTSW